ncbi:MAG: adenylate/guanylate cyclase domain-containing protein, partial [Proteobacteria bacterium]|nr:adenylate/guanylate cyclase domain-containing protein [Pseudomonadota bacterium]
AHHGLTSKIINATGGRVNKVLGDGILAYYMKGNLDTCVNAAMDIQRALATHNMLPAGIGLDYGEAILGDLGQDARLDYTLIGSSVNLASRMCDIAKAGEIGLSKSLFELLTPTLRAKITELPAFCETWVRVKPTDPRSEAVTFAIDKVD